MQYAFTAANRTENQSLAGLKVAGRQMPTIPMHDVHLRFTNRGLAPGDKGGRARAGQSTEQQVHQANRQFGIAVGPRDQLRQAAQHIDVGSNMPKRQILKILGAEGLFLDWGGYVQRYLHSIAR